MDNALSNHAHESVTDLGEDFDGLWLWDNFLLLHESPKLAVLAVLLDDVEEVGGFHHLEAAHDVLAFEGFENLNFGVDCLLDVVVLVDWIRGRVLVFLSSILTATWSLVMSYSPL